MNSQSDKKSKKDSTNLKTNKPAREQNGFSILLEAWMILSPSIIYPRWFKTIVRCFVTLCSYVHEMNRLSVREIETSEIVDGADNIEFCKNCSPNVEKISNPKQWISK